MPQIYTFYLLGIYLCSML